MVYDVTDRESFQNLSVWMNEIEKHASGDVSRVLVGNKSDLDHERKVTRAEGAAAAKHYGMKFVEASAKTAANVQDLFKIMAEEVQTRLAKAPTGTAGGSTGKIPKGTKLGQGEKKKGGYVLRVCLCRNIRCC